MTNTPFVTQPKVAYLGLGSNLGSRELMLSEALCRLHQRQDTDVDAVSALYETDPVGYLEQPSFLNIVCRIETLLSPEALLQAVLDIERRLGRERIVRWGPRTIDIDILLYQNVSFTSDDLCIPHPRLMERAFVLIPLLEVMPATERHWDPGFEIVQDLSDGVRRWETNSWPLAFERSANLKDTHNNHSP
jgi:2-amino-4-hydroxy-6-hydroxymethyldihydropteridine diphosphokinase